ncbi:hypothetical protein [Sphingomonas sp.]|uniref:hypothetical protein n=1 Tax=Sphingomonas sp. TaxID=28214 RepID=UPI002ED83BB8
MSNSLVTVHFADPAEGERLYLDPQIVPDLANALGMVVGKILGASQILGQPPLRLAAISPGSIKIDYLVVVDAGVYISETSPAKGWGETVTIISAAVSAMAAVATLLGLAVPATQEKADAPSKVERQLIDAAVQNREVRIALEQLQRVVASSGSRNVTLSVPGAPSCRLIDDGSFDVRLIGSRAKPVVTVPREYRGKLHITGEPLVFKRQAERQRPGGVVTLYPASVEIDGGREPLLIEWNSVRPVPAPRSPDVHVVGNIQPIKMDGLDLQTESAIPQQFRDARGLVVVSKQVVEE